MDFHSFLRSRRSIRRFTPKPIGKEVLTRIIETATHAPSAHNRQPWRFVVINNADVKFKLSEDMAKEFEQDLVAEGLEQQTISTRLERSKTRINNAPVVIILCMDMREMDTFPDEAEKASAAERIMATQSVAAAGLQLQLAAHAEGIDSVWTCGPLFTQRVVQQSLGLNPNWEPQAMFFLGIAAEKPKEKILKKVEEVVIFI